MSTFGGNMKRVTKQYLSFAVISGLFLTYQNCGKAVSYNTTETVFESTVDPMSQMGEFAKTAQNVNMNISMGYRACMGPCVALPSLNINFAAKTFSFSYGIERGPTRAGDPVQADECVIQGSVTSQEEVDLKRRLDTISMHMETRSTCTTD